MRSKTAKYLRKIIKQDSKDPVINRIYRRAKKSWNKLNTLEKKRFVKEIESNSRNN